MTTGDTIQRLLVAEYEFFQASVAVWKEIDRLDAEPGGYRGLDAGTALRQRERAAWEELKEARLLHRRRYPSPPKGQLMARSGAFLMAGGAE